MRFAYRCPRSFGDLEANGACAACGRTVVDLSVLTEDQAEARVRAEPGLCGRVLRDGSGGWIRRSVGPISAIVLAQPCVATDPPAVAPEPAAVESTLSYIQVGSQAVEARTLRERSQLEMLGYLEPGPR